MALIKKQYKRQRKSRKQQKRLKKRKQQKRKTKKRGKYVRKGGAAAAAAAEEAEREYIILENILSNDFNKIIDNNNIKDFNMIYSRLSGAENEPIVTRKHTITCTNQKMVKGTTYLIIYKSFKVKNGEVRESFDKTKYIGKFTPRYDSYDSYDSYYRGAFYGMEYTPNTHNKKDEVKKCVLNALTIDTGSITDNKLKCFTFN